MTSNDAMMSNDDDEMSNDEALRRVQHGGTIIIMDVPPGTEFGIDCTLFTVGEKFRGVKMVPPGLHLVLLGAAGNDVTRVAEFVRVAPADVHVRRWDPHTETFAPGTGHDPEQTARLQMARGDTTSTPPPARTPRVRRRCGADLRRTSRRTCWRGVACRSGRVSRPGTRTSPSRRACAAGRKPRRRRARAAATNAATNAATTSTSASDVPVAPSFGDAASRAPAGASPAEITALGHDPEARLRRAVDASRGGDWAHLLGSNQTAFVLFLLLGSEPALAHWKATTALMCDAAVSCAAAHAQLYEAFTASFAAQLDRAAETLFEDEDLSEFSEFSGDVARKGGHNFLRAALVALTGGLREALDGHEQNRGARGTRGRRDAAPRAAVREVGAREVRRGRRGGARGRG